MTTEVMIEIDGLDIYAEVYAYGVFTTYMGDEGYRELEQWEDPIYRHFYYYDEDGVFQSPNYDLLQRATDALTDTYWRIVAESNEIEGEY